MLSSYYDILRHLIPVDFRIERVTSFLTKYAPNHCVVIHLVIAYLSLPDGSLRVKQHTFPKTSTPFSWEVAVLTEKAD
jgi:hypothetical protein